MSIFQLKIRVNARVSYEVRSRITSLGDGADSVGVPCGRFVAEVWTIDTIVATEEERDRIDEELRSRIGVTDFQWRLRSPYIDEDGLTITPDEYGDFVCEGWVESRLGESCWQFALTFERSDIYELDECVLRSPDLADDLPLLDLHLYWNQPQQEWRSQLIKNQYDGGVIERREYGYNAVRDSWQLSANLHEARKDAIVQFLKDRCGNHFGFKPTPSSLVRSYACTQWECAWLGGQYWQVSIAMTGNHNPFKESYVKTLSTLFDFYDNEQDIRDAIVATFSDLDSMLAIAPEFINSYTRNTVPFIATADYEVVNNFHPNILGRGGYFPSSAFPTEAQSIAMRDCCKAYLATGDDRWRTMAINFGNSMLSRFYPVAIPSNWTEADGIRIPHWLRFKNYRSVNFPLKGAIAEDPLSYGYFDLVVSFTNGEGLVSSGSPNFGDLLSNVYRVYPAGDRLLWKNVYAVPLGGFSYAIDYWVSWNENGINTRYYSDTESPGGRSPEPTSEPVGKIKLATDYTGSAKVVYASRTGYVAAPGESMYLEPYPMWRSLREGEALGAIDIFPWAHEGYALLYQITGDSKWLTAKNCTEYTEAIAANVINPSAWYKKDDSPNALAYAGSQFIPVPETRGYATSRVTSGGLKDYLRIDIDSSPDPFPSGEYQNYAVQILAVDNMTVTSEVACSVSTELEIVLSLSSNPFDFSRYYVARLAIAPNIPASRTFALNEFLLWDINVTSWHPYIAESPVYDYSGSGGVVLEKVRVESAIAGVPRNVWKIRLDRNSGFVGAGFVMLGIRPRFPLQIYMKHSGPAEFKATIGDKEYFCNIPSAADWGLVTIASNQFKDEDNRSPSTSSAIADLQIVPTSSSVTETWIWYIGQPPKTIDPPAQTYKAAIVTRVKTAHTLYVGDFYATGSPTEDLAYGDSAVVFTANAETDGQGGQFIAAWRGLKASGYQYPAYYVRTAQWRRLRGVLQFLLDAQEARKQKLGYYSSFESAFVTPYWDNIEYSETGELNVWVAKFSDPNYFWVGYSVRPLESVAEAWYRLVSGEHPGAAPSDRTELIKECKLICDRYAFWLSSFYVRRRKYSPPTIFYETEEPSATYHEPHAAGFYLRFATWGNLAGGNAALYLRLAKASYNYLQDSFVGLGTMAGTWSGLQPNFTEGSFTGKEYFGFWNFENINALSLLKSKKDALRYPKCVYFIKTGSFQL
jgi:phage-related protein